MHRTCISSTCRRFKPLQVRHNSTVTLNDPHDVAKLLRGFMRAVAQPVTVISTRLADEKHSLHGATLSSVSSVGLHPLPLVAFSLRQPSRLADALHSNRSANPNTSHCVINFLAAHQSELAIRFSRPDLHPEPFTFATYHHDDDLPVFDEILGALSCSVLTSLPLSSKVLGQFGFPDKLDLSPEQEHSSELFVARVNRVLVSKTTQNVDRRPLIYHEGTFKSVNS
ncbi:hypothetical protein BDV93DRAFT_33831 [Ceratobasidium sp. AG-I]|nr:hypothetical protein BDV93DRAFT_33831 [Ceratobasidium sp. AG-I]